MHQKSLKKFVRWLLEIAYENSLVSPENKFAAAYTNNNQTILLNTLVSEFVIIDNPFGEDENVMGIYLLENVLVVYGRYCWIAYNMQGTVHSELGFLFYIVAQR